MDCSDFTGAAFGITCRGTPVRSGTGQRRYRDGGIRMNTGNGKHRAVVFVAMMIWALDPALAFDPFKLEPGAYKEKAHKSRIESQDGQTYRLYNTNSKIGAQVRDTQCDCWRNHGRITTFYTSGEKHTEAFFRYGKKEGVETHYFEDGDVSKEIEYVKGRKRGDRTEYRKVNNNNTVNTIRVTPFFDDKVHGKEIWYFPDGKTKREEILYNCGFRLQLTKYRKDGSTEKSKDFTPEGYKKDVPTECQKKAGR